MNKSTKIKVTDPKEIEMVNRMIAVSNFNKRYEAKTYFHLFCFEHQGIDVEVIAMVDKAANRIQFLAKYMQLNYICENDTCPIDATGDEISKFAKENCIEEIENYLKRV